MIPIHSPAVSVIIPVFNHGRFLAEAIESAIRQTLPPTEIIVVDDGSTDDSGRIAKAFAQVTLLTQKRAGAGAARNHGINAASGEYIAFLDADDVWVDDKLENQTEILGENPDVDMVYGAAQQFYSPEVIESGDRPDADLPETLPGVIPGAMLIRSRSMRRVGMFDTGLRLGEFIDWYSRARQLGLREIRTEDVVYHRRIHHSNQGIREQQSRSDYLKVLKRNLDRKRRNKPSDSGR